MGKARFLHHRGSRCLAAHTASTVPHNQIPGQMSVLKTWGKSPPVCCLPPSLQPPSPPPVFTLFSPSVGAACWVGSWMLAAGCLGCKCRRQREGMERGEDGRLWLSPAGFMLFFCAPLVTADRNFFLNATGCPVFGISATNPLLPPQGSPIRTDSAVGGACGLKGSSAAFGEGVSAQE